MFNIESELKKLPNKPGVYIMHDKEDNIGSGYFNSYMDKSRTIQGNGTDLSKQELAVCASGQK